MTGPSRRRPNQDGKKRGEAREKLDRGRKPSWTSLFELAPGGSALGRIWDCLSIENVTFCTATFMAHDGIVPAESKGRQMSRRRPARRDPLGEDMKYVVYDILYQGFSSSGYLTFNFAPLRLRSRSDGQSSPQATPVTTAVNPFIIHAQCAPPPCHSTPHQPNCAYWFGTGVYIPQYRHAPARSPTQSNLSRPNTASRREAKYTSLVSSSCRSKPQRPGTRDGR